MSRHVRRIVAFGDSFPAGINKVEGVYNSIENRKEINFVNQLSLLTEVEHLNFGRPGHSNMSISYDIHKFFREENYRQDDLIIVCWSGFFRNFVWDFDSKRFAAHYIPEMEGDNEDYVREVTRTYSFILNTIYLLEKNLVNYKFIPSFVDYKTIEVLNKLIYEYENSWIHGNQFNATLLGIVTNQLGVDNSFLEKIHRKEVLHDLTDLPYDKNLLSPCSHPNAEGHKVIANYLYSYFLNSNVFAV